MSSAGPGRLVLVLSAAAVACAAVAAYCSRHLVLREWYEHRLRTGDAEEQAQAIQALARVDRNAAAAAVIAVHASEPDAAAELGRGVLEGTADGASWLRVVLEKAPEERWLELASWVTPAAVRRDPETLDVLLAIRRRAENPWALQDPLSEIAQEVGPSIACAFLEAIDPAEVARESDEGLASLFRAALFSPGSGQRIVYPLECDVLAADVFFGLAIARRHADPELETYSRGALAEVLPILSCDEKVSRILVLVESAKERDRDFGWALLYRALCLRPPWTETIVEAALSRLGDGTAGAMERAAIAFVLVRYSLGSEPCNAALGSLLRDESRDVRYFTVHALGAAVRSETHSPAEVVPRLLSALGGALGRDAELAREIVEVLGDLGTEEAIPALEALVERTESGLADAARDAIEGIREHPFVPEGAIQLEPTGVRCGSGP